LRGERREAGGRISLSLSLLITLASHSLRGCGSVTSLAGFSGIPEVYGFPEYSFIPASRLSLPTSYALEVSVPVWALPLSLATTQGINDFFSSSGYLDVSVPRVPSPQTMCSSESTCPLRQVGFPIRTPPVQSLLSAPRGFSQIAASFVGS
jgi:hypothetical protein